MTLESLLKKREQAHAAAQVADALGAAKKEAMFAWRQAGSYGLPTTELDRLCARIEALQHKFRAKAQP